MITQPSVWREELARMQLQDLSTMSIDQLAVFNVAAQTHLDVMERGPWAPQYVREATEIANAFRFLGDAALVMLAYKQGLFQSSPAS